MSSRSSSPRWQLNLGECDGPDGLAAIETASVGALVTDPPAGIGFMGKVWDSDRGGRAAWVGWLTGIMRECLRVLKPGAHGFVWALPRTSHWTATALEDAGFEIRDVVTHHFGTGFPKSLDVSKAIDAAAGAKREVVGTKLGLPGYSPTVGKGANCYGDGLGGKGNGVREAEVTAPATPSAKRWAGWGTALKPATEHWILVRKPLDGTVAANVLRHGTGALNIDGCRVGIDEAERYIIDNRSGSDDGERDIYGNGVGKREKGTTFKSHLAGRWPANLVLTHQPDCAGACAPGCPVAELDEQSGELVSGGPAVGSAGGASRFFYVAKPDRGERDAGCASLPLTTGGEATGRKEGAAALNSPRTGAGRGGGARNNHPTVKPVELMEWLIRLITPPGATMLVLDPFAGSGTTGVAAVRLRHDFVGWEREPAYLEIARKRLEVAAPQPEQLRLFR